MTTPKNLQPSLLGDVHKLIYAARQSVAQAMNAKLHQLYWKIGRCISNELLQGQRAGYDKHVMAALASQLTADFGKGWSEQQHRHYICLAEVFSQESIFFTLWRELTSSYLKALMYIDDLLKRDFYLEIYRVEHWSMRQLQERINSLLFERTVNSRKIQETIRQDIYLLRAQGKLAPDLTYRHSYIHNFLGLSDNYSEPDFESAILAQMQRFINVLGSYFTFFTHQKRIIISSYDCFIDLLFYHRRQRRLVAIDLKLGEIEGAHRGQMEIYQRYLEKHEKMKEDTNPISLILCRGKSIEHLELLQLP